ncbi:MAG: ECF transporter S component [Oscillospiraceae bacterium]|nr:ECF transporter S component [Oscillospiraceae bacterium]
MKRSMSRSTHNITVTAMLSAVAFILMFLEFPAPLMPSFVKLDISDLPALLGTFALGPVSGIVIEGIKNLLFILFHGTSSAGVGELCNFLLGCCFVVPSGLIYRRRKTRKRAVVGSLVGCAVMAACSLPINLFLVYPAYVRFYGLPLENIIEMYQAILPGVNSLLACLTIFNLPFTFIKGLLDALLCFLIYKPLSPILHHGRGDS